MDFVSIILLGALNVPLLLLFCGIIRKRLHRDGEENFWRSLLAWSFDPHAFFDREYRHNHLAVLLVSVSVACCIVLMLVEYELAYRFVDNLRTYQPLHALLRF